jgi:DNA-binding NtrC family response regulator
LGSGKYTMAQYIKKAIFKNAEIKINRNITTENDFNINEVAIYTINCQNWIQLRTKLQNENLRVITMPSLKDRKSDLPALAEFFLQVLSLMKGQPQLHLNEKSLEMILQYGWPGHFYEFESVLEGASEAVFKNSSGLLIEPHHLNLNTRPQNFEYTVGMKLDEIERKFILQTLYFVYQNRTKAAEILGISIRTLRNKISQYREEGFL